jgi:hypothetical protein
MRLSDPDAARTPETLDVAIRIPQSPNAAWPHDVVCSHAAAAWWRALLLG